MPSITPMMSTTLFDIAHRHDHFVDHLAAARCDIRRIDGQLARLPCVFRVLAHRAGQLIHARRGLLQRCGLLLGALRQIGIAHRDFARTGVDRFGTAVYRLHQRGHTVLHLADRLEQAAHFIAALRIDVLCQIAGGDPLEARDRIVQRPHDHAAQREAHCDQHHQRDHDAADDQCAHRFHMRDRVVAMLVRTVLQCLDERRRRVVERDEHRADLRIRDLAVSGQVDVAQRGQFDLHTVVHQRRAARRGFVD
jgi:hypothetical protein